MLGPRLLGWSTGAHVPELIVMMALAAIAGGTKVSLIPHKGDKDAVSMSLGFVITFLALLKIGPVGALGAGVVSCLTGCLYPKRQPFYQLAFNVGLSAVEALIGGAVYWSLNGQNLEISPAKTFLAVTVSTLAFFLVNTGGVSLMISLCTNLNPFRLWRETFLWTAPSYLAGACVSALAMVILGHSSVFVLLFVVPIVFVIYHSYSISAKRTEEKLHHVEEMQANQERLAELYLATIKSLALAIDAKDQYTHQHILRVQRYAVALAKRMGLTGAELEAVNTGALLHDIGKLGVPEYVLLKPGKLTDSEFDKIKKHPEIGAAILDPVEFPWPVLPVVKYHHEKWDGTGYPEGLKGEEIPLTARIMAVADVYDALTSSRSYRRAWSHERALGVIVKDAGTHFDPACVEAFVDVIEDVIHEMAAEGCGPLADLDAEMPKPGCKTTQAALEISRSAAEFWAMYEVANTLAAFGTLDEAAVALAEKLSEAFPESLCLLMVLDPYDGLLRLGAVKGLGSPDFDPQRPVAKSSFAYEALETRKTYLGRCSPIEIAASGLDFEGARILCSALVAPVIGENEALGVICLYHPEDGFFSGRDRDILETVAEQTARSLGSRPSDSGLKAA